MEEMGLAGASAQMPASSIGLEEVVAMIMQGMDPEELIERGVPQELVEAAMQKLMAQMGPVAGEMGLAGSVVKPLERKDVV